MNAFKKIILLVYLVSNVSVFAQKKDSLGLPGDNFDLYGALELFKKSKTPEDFEKAINSNDNEINNLDLDADGKVDYVKVIDKTKDDSHSLVLQVDVSKTETQDVAVIEIEKTKSNDAHLQIVGDEELYGKNYIIEPKDESAATTSAQPSSKTKSYDDDVYRSPDDNNNSNNNNSNNNYNNNNYAYDPGPAVMVNVWAWPSVQYIYGPGYSVWISPWYWGYYPGWWSPWYPVYWPVYYRRVYRYHHPYYHRTNYYTCNAAHNYYYGRRSSSITVSQYNRNGTYQQKQMSYKENVQSGRKYNALPANAEKQEVIHKREAKEPKPINTQPKKAYEQPGEIKSQPKNNQPVKNEQINKAPREFNNQPIKQPKEINNPPKQTNPPVQKAPRQQQSVPVQKNPGMSFPQNRSGGGGGGMRGGGGRRGR